MIAVAVVGRRPARRGRPHARRSAPGRCCSAPPGSSCSACCGRRCAGAGRGRGGRGERVGGADAAAGCADRGGRTSVGVRGPTGSSRCCIPAATPSRSRNGWPPTPMRARRKIASLQRRRALRRASAASAGSPTAGWSSCRAVGRGLRGGLPRAPRWSSARARRRRDCAALVIDRKLWRASGALALRCDRRSASRSSARASADYDRPWAPATREAARRAPTADASGAARCDAEAGRSGSGGSVTRRTRGAAIQPTDLDHRRETVE